MFPPNKKMKIFKTLTVASALTTLFASQAIGAGVLLQDNFDAENGGTGILNYGTVNGVFANWTVSDGHVDLIGNGFF